jgi:hypothetical protein
MGTCAHQPAAHVRRSQAAAAGFGLQNLREANTARVRRMSLLSGALGVVMVAQTHAWLAALAVE